MSDALVFRKLYEETDRVNMQLFRKAAIDKLSTLYPGNSIFDYGTFTIGISSDSLYAENGIDIYDMGLVDDELPALQRQRDGEVITLRII